MPVSREFASSKGACRSLRREKILVVSPSWLGDSIMMMPALLDLRRQAGVLHLVVLAKPAVASVWRMCSGVDEVIVLTTGIRGSIKAVKAVKAGQFDFAYVVPNSFRAALIPYLAKVPGRRGFTGHQRRWMLTESIPVVITGTPHQSQEAYDLFGIAAGPKREEVLIKPDEQDRQDMMSRLQLPEGEAALLVAMFPGAARGPSKCWPEERFAEVGRRLAGRGCRIVLLGAPLDRESCERIAGQIGAGAINMAGMTTLAALAGLLSLCRVVVANDSGGMHLAAAVGTRVVALYGATDPEVTGPMGNGHCVLMAPGIHRGRDVPRRSAVGKAALDAISADSVYEAVARALASAR
jgi:heptosyltransferase-2